MVVVVHVVGLLLWQGRVALRVGGGGGVRLECPHHGVQQPGLRRVGIVCHTTVRGQGGGGPAPWRGAAGGGGGGGELGGVVELCVGGLMGWGGWVGGEGVGRLGRWAGFPHDRQMFD